MSEILPFRSERPRVDSRDGSRSRNIVVTGIGMITSVGASREETWHALRHGRSGAVAAKGLRGVPDFLTVAAPVSSSDIPAGRLKVIELCRRAAKEAITDSGVDIPRVDANRFASAISVHMGDSSLMSQPTAAQMADQPGTTPWWHQWLPNTACTVVANEFGLYGPRLSHSTACASSLTDIIAAARAIQCDQCDIALAGGGEAIHPLMAAGFARMRVLAEHEDPRQACRPFDLHRRGFVMGEGAAMLVLESLDHARRRGAKIYAELAAGQLMAEGHHVTDLDEDGNTLSRLISTTLRRARIRPEDVGYINAHGTGTVQNDLAESRGIHRAFGNAAHKTCVSGVKSMLGHLVIAAGSVELAVTALALRDGFLPPTINLTDPDPACDLDCLPLEGRRRKAEHALKLSVAFGGHLSAAVLRRWSAADARSAEPDISRAA